MRKFDLIITDRYHAAIFAILAHTPVLPVNPQYKTEKTEGLFSLFEYPVKVLPHVRDDTYDQMTKNISYLVKKKKEIRKMLSKASADLKNRCEKDYRVLSKIVEVR
jgi:polysaccharide pyruvyl transferase WcaK-like protein